MVFGLFRNESVERRRIPLPSIHLRNATIERKQNESHFSKQKRDEARQTDVNATVGSVAELLTVAGLPMAESKKELIARSDRNRCRSTSSEMTR